MGERGVRLAAGILVIGTGIPLMLTSHFGVAPFDVLGTGVARAAHINLGFAIVLMNLTFIAIAGALGQRPGVGTLCGAIFVGPIVGVVLTVLPVPTLLAVQVTYVSAGAVTISVGISLVLSSDLGPGPSELVMLGLIRQGIPLRWARTATELASVIAGSALGGAFGAGTIFFALAIGHLLAFFLPRIRRAAGNPSPVPITTA